MDPALKKDFYNFLLIFQHKWMFLSRVQTLPNQIPLGPAEMISLLSSSVEWGFYSCWIYRCQGEKCFCSCWVFGLPSLHYICINLLGGLWRKKWTYCETLIVCLHQGIVVQKYSFWKIDATCCWKGLDLSNNVC